MRRSRSIPLTLMATLAAACSGGEQPQQTASAEWGEGLTEARYCADSTGRVVPDEECARPRSGGVYPFLWYYGATRMLGANGAYYVRGGHATTEGVGTGRLPPARGPVSRGGLGATGGGRSGAIGA